MFRNSVQTWLVAPTTHRNRHIYWFWFAASAIVAGTYGLEVWQQAFSTEFVVSDDTRQHVFWMQRFIDPELFPNDSIADYFQSVAPRGYTEFYRLFAKLGIDPLLTSKLIPPILGLISTSCCFLLCLEIFPVPAAGFLASVLFTQNLWMLDVLSAATPRAFLNPLFLAFLYYLIRRSPWCFIALAAIGLFYPQYVLVSVGVLILTPLSLEKGRLKISRDRREYWFCILGSIVAFLVLLPYALKTSDFAPTITAAEARLMPEFLPGGRVRFFYEDFGRYWLNGGRSGIQIPFDPPLLVAGMILPVLLHFPDRFPLVVAVRSHLKILGHLTLSSLGLFFVAHALLFKLHLPSRYTQHSLRVIMSLSAAIALIILLDSIFRWATGFQHSSFWLRSEALSLGAVAILLGYLMLYPTSLSNFPKTNYQFGSTPELYQFFARQPKEISIASISSEANNLPTFAHRSIISGQEYAIPYHLGYYRSFQSGTSELIQAQYTESLLELQNFIKTYEIDFWLLENETLTLDYIEKNDWMKQYSKATQQAIKLLEEGRSPAFKSVLERCSKFQLDSFTVVPTECVLNLSRLAVESVPP
ncbi:hypothetical protein IQ235_13685 [Oscillatoriales cyanobacterium LEGE 11467]|uniref:Uncharacterized protein n=1 Tax=Zarconia navalis LEGE 11467 TaxID=1828826 RepID=A0A928VX40_9CYAN|nr:hypothetical protein [Zarconia navalis]MBE9041832.1 hypothetical protein [Zarconia navalis LEGE 11467]